MMNLHHLRYFLTIAEEGSLAAASRKLLVGQPALSAQLKQFEEWIGSRLFERVGKKLEITQVGEYVLKYAKAIQELETELLQNLSHADQMLGRELIIGAQESVPKIVLAETIGKIKKIRPLRIKIIEGTGDELFHLLLKSKIDMFIGNFRPLSESKEMVYKLVGKENVAVWGTESHRNLTKNFPKSLEGHAFILPGFNNPIRHEFEKFMLQNGLDFSITIEAQDTALQKELAFMGEGLILFGEESLKNWPKASGLRKVGTVPGIYEEYWLGMAKREIDNQSIKAILAAF